MGLIEMDAILCAVTIVDASPVGLECRPDKGKGLGETVRTKPKLGKGGIWVMAKPRNLPQPEQLNHIINPFTNPHKFSSYVD